MTWAKRYQYLGRALVEIQISGKTVPSTIPNVPQHTPLGVRYAECGVTDYFEDDLAAFFSSAAIYLCENDGSQKRLPS